VEQRVFRQAMLDRLASPEQLDQLISITDRRGWIVLLSITVVLVTAVGWGVMGSIPQTIGGAGILIRSGGIFEVAPVAGGRVVDIGVSTGDLVTEGQVVARIAQPDLAERLRETEAVLAVLRQQHRALVERAAADIELQTAFLARQRATVREAIASAEAALGWYREKIVIQEQLAQEGLITRQTLLTTRQQRDATSEKISDGHSQLAQIAVRELDVRNQHDEALRRSQDKIDEQQRAVDDRARQLELRSEVVATHTGRILEIMTEQGAVVADSQPILTLDLMGRAVKDLEAIIYVPSGNGKQIRPGMAALIAPSVARQEEFGFMLGRVTHVSEFPATPRGMQRVLKNDKLVASLAGADAPYEVHADLVVDPQTPSRYRWSSSRGPNVNIQSGTLAVAQITVDFKRPIEMVIPWARLRAGL
jgi:HlyD family secretion protein